MAKAKSSAAVDPGGEFPFDVPTYLFHLFVVIARYRDLSLDHVLRPLRLNVTRHRAISVIARMEPCTMSQLADFSAVDRTTMTRTVDQLVATGLVERATSPRDRRQVILTLTAAGRDAYRRSLRAIRKHNQASLARIPETRRRQAVRALEAVLFNLVPDPDLAQRLTFRPDAGASAHSKTPSSPA